MKTPQADLFGFLFEHRDRRIDRLGNPLLELDAQVDWEAFRPLLEQVRNKVRKSSAGRKPWDVVMMFKALVLASLYNLSDEQLEFQIEDRRSFQRFIGLSDAKRVPDRNSFWLFRESLKELKLTEALFNAFNRQLDRAGLIARKGQWVDASFVKAPVQRNTPDENAQIKAGETVEDWPAPKRRQKDTDARWTKKGGKSHYGYKNHVNVDNAHNLVRKYCVTDASVHDSQALGDVLDRGNTSRKLWGRQCLSFRSHRRAVKSPRLPQPNPPQRTARQAADRMGKAGQQNPIQNPLPGRARVCLDGPMGR
jgi:transposase, IS5 family